MTSKLATLLEEMEWENIKMHIKNTPDEANSMSCDELAALQAACIIKASTDSLLRLLKMHPTCCLMTDKLGQNVLHYCCKNFIFFSDLCIEKAKILLKAGIKKQTSMIDINGDTPLHLACFWDAPQMIIEELLRLNRSIVFVKNKKGITPLQSVWESYEKLFIKENLNKDKGIFSLISSAWPKVMILIKATYYELAGTDKNVIFSPVIAAHCIDCPKSFKKIILRAKDNFSVENIYKIVSSDPSLVTDEVKYSNGIPLYVHANSKIDRNIKRAVSNENTIPSKKIRSATLA